MKIPISNKLRRISASLKSDINKTKKTKKIIVFLGGECPEGNDWRKEIKREFKGGDIFFLDPYDTSWQADENIYNELEGILIADHVVFYKGGPGSRKEMKFLDSVKDGEYEKFKDLEDLKEYLGKVSEPIVSKKKESVKVAKKGQEYSLCSTQVDFSEDFADKVIAWGKKIPDSEIYVEDDGGCGREDEIHVTLLYGLKEDDPEKVKNMLSGVKPFDLILGTITGFLDNDKFDVLKIDVDSPEMQKIHYMLEDSLPNENSYPTYHPHITIAYLKKGEAEKYIGGDDFRGKKFKANTIMFSSRDGSKVPIKLED
jgi:2'-5' RNA ligase